MITLICALPEEAKHLRRLTILQNGSAQLICSGVGPHNAERATRNLLSTSKPKLVVSAGVAGALSPTLRIGDVVVATEVIDELSGQRFICSQQSATPKQSGLAKAFGVGNRQSAILSASHMITSADEKKTLGQKFDAVAVDMESSTIARVCAEHGIPFAAIRAISDTAEEVLPEAITRFFDEDGRLRLGRVIAELIRRPSLMKDLRRLQSQTAIAGDELRIHLDAHPIA